MELRLKRQQLRKHPTRSESVLWQAIRNRQCGVKFRRQFSIGHFILDFYCHELKLAIEADGYTHESSEAKRRDRDRHTSLEKYGIRFLRFTDGNILSNVEKVVKRIKCEIELLKKERAPV